MNKGDRLNALMATMKEIGECYRRDDYKDVLKKEVQTIDDCIKRMLDMLSDEKTWVQEMEDLRRTVQDTIRERDISYSKVGREIGFSGSVVHDFCTALRKGRSPELMGALRKWVGDNALEL